MTKARENRAATTKAPRKTTTTKARTKAPTTTATPDPMLGAVPQHATHWACRKLAEHPERLPGHKRWTWCEWEIAQGVAGKEFPIGSLNPAEVRRRWGPGTFRLMYLVLAEGNKKVAGQGPAFRLLPLAHELVAHYATTDEGDAEAEPQEPAAATPPASPQSAPAAGAVAPVGPAPIGGRPAFPQAAVPDLNIALGLWQYLQGAADGLAQKQIERERQFFQAQMQMMREHWERLGQTHPGESELRALRAEVAELADGRGIEPDEGGGVAAAIESVSTQIVPLAQRALEVWAASKMGGGT